MVLQGYEGPSHPLVALFLLMSSLLLISCANVEPAPAVPPLPETLRVCPPPPEVPTPPLTVEKIAEWGYEEAARGDICAARLRRVVGLYDGLSTLTNKAYSSD